MVRTQRTERDDYDMSGDGPKAASDSSESLLHSSMWPAEHLLALGRVLEEAAKAEHWARSFVREAFDAAPAYANPEARRALAIQNSGLELLLLGSRMTGLITWLRALASVDGMPPWLAQATDWGKNAESVFKVRDDLVHRAPIMTGPVGKWVPGMARARRAHRVEPVGDAALELLRRLVALNRDAWDIALHISDYEQQQREALGLQ